MFKNSWKNHRVNFKTEIYTTDIWVSSRDHSNTFQAKNTKISLSNKIFINFSLKRLQIIDLITKSGIFYRQNISIPTDDFLVMINTFNKDFDAGQFYRWHNIFNSYSSEIITDMGLCNTINIANLSDVLHTDVVSHDFHYELTYMTSYDIHKNLTRPLRTATSSAGLDVIMTVESDFDVNADYYYPPTISSLVSIF